MMESAQTSYEQSERLIRTISNLRTFSTANDDVEQLLDAGADVNGLHGTLLPLQCACMVNDQYCIQLLLERGALVRCFTFIGVCLLWGKVLKIVVPSSVVE